MSLLKYETITLEQLKSDLLLIKAKSCYQENEIERTKSFIISYEDCIKKQTEALNNYILENDKLEEEKVNIKSLLKIAENQEKNAVVEQVNTEEVRTEKVRAKKTKRCDDIRGESDIKKLCPEDGIMKTEKFQHIKKESGTRKTVKMENCEPIKDEPDTVGSVNDQESEDASSITPRRKWNNKNFLDRKVHQIIAYRHNIYLCGSRGMLHRIVNNKTTVVDTGTKDDIKQMTLFKYNGVLSLAAFSTTQMILFVDILKVQCPESHEVSVTGSVFQDNHVIYMPICGGEIRKINKNDTVIESHICHDHGNVRFFVPCYGQEKQRALISLHDRRLYKTLEKDFDILEVIEGIANVRHLSRIGDSNFLCCSKRKLWILNSEPSITRTLKFKDAIKFVSGQKDIIAIVTETNQLFVYEDKVDANDVQKIHEQQFNEKITALSTYKMKIYLLIQDEIVTLRITR